MVSPCESGGERLGQDREYGGRASRGCVKSSFFSVERIRRANLQERRVSRAWWPTLPVREGGSARRADRSFERSVEGDVKFMRGPPSSCHNDCGGSVRSKTMRSSWQRRRTRWVAASSRRRLRNTLMEGLPRGRS